MHGRSRSGMPQVHDRPFDSSLPISKFIFWLHVNPGSLEGGNLRLKLIVKLFQCIIELFQCILLMGGIFAIESCLFPIAI